MPVLRPVYIKGAVLQKDWPPDAAVEVCFCGRSNVGKSSLLNKLVGQRIARISKTPGRTRLLHFFQGDVQTAAGPVSLSLVDLPGFGYAQVPTQERKHWFTMIETYFTQRASLQLVFLLVDARRVADLVDRPHALQEEVDLHAYLTSLHKQVVLVLTKADQIPKNKRKPLLDIASKRFSTNAPCILFSALTSEGLPALESKLQRLAAQQQP